MQRRLARRDRSWSTAVAVAMACVLMAATLAGALLYLSAAASEAVQLQLAAGCPAANGLTLPVANIASADGLARTAATVPHTAAPILTSYTRVSYQAADGTGRGVIIVHRDGQEAHVTPPLADLPTGSIAYPRSALERAGLHVGDVLTVTLPAGPDEVEEHTAQLTIGAVFDDLPFQPELPFWCWQARLYTPNAAGDPPRAPMVLASAATVALLGPDATGWEWELDVDRPDVTRDEAADTEAGFLRVIGELERLEGAEPGTLRRGGHESLNTLVTRGESIAGAVHAAVAPVRLAGLLAALLVLLAAAVMVARHRRRTLRLLALRGVAPWRTALLMLPTLAAPVVLGATAGFVVAVLGVRLFGPTAELEPAAVRAAAISVAVATVVALLLVAGAVAVIGDRFVDPRPVHRWWRWIPFELPLVAAAVLAFRRLEDVGGVRMTGVYSRGGDLVAQSFDLLAIIAVIGVLVRPVRWLAARCRTVGTRLPRAVRLGVRRAVGDPGLTTSLIAAVALATACSLLAIVLTSTAQRELDDKATIFVGSDLSINVKESAVVPPALADRATAIARLIGDLDGRKIDILGVDPTTFERAVHWTSTASSSSLPSLLRAITAPSLADGEEMPVIVVNAPQLTAPVTLAGSNDKTPIRIRPVATARYFPGFQSGTVMIVVDIRAITRVDVPHRDSIWVKDPPANAADLIRASGAHIRSLAHADRVFDVLAYSAERWSYGPLAAFGLLVAIMALTMQLLVIDARLASRRLSHLMLRRTGFTTRDVHLAALVELVLPLAVGFGLGVAAGLVAAHLSVTKLDPLPNLVPPAVEVVPGAAVAAAALVTLVAAVLLAVVSARATRRGDPMEAIRGTA